MRYLIALLALLLIVAGCSTYKLPPKPSPNQSALRALANAPDPTNPSNRCTNCPGDTNIFIPPFNPGTNLCILPWSFLITNHIPVGGHFDNSYTFTISNLVAGSNYAVQFVSTALAQGSNNWLNHAQFTASNVTRNWTEFVIETTPTFWWRVEWVP